jgi:hypothetical protein
MTPIEMHYSCIGFAYQATVWVGRLLAEKLFDVVLAGLGTWLGYWLARRHLEHFIRKIVKEMDDKYLDVNKKLAFQNAVTAMIPELPQFYLRPTRTFSPSVAGALGDFTHWATAIDPKHTPEESMKLVGTEAYKQSEAMIEKGMGFREAVSVPNYEWELGIGSLPIGWTVDEVPALTIYNWDTGAAVYRHAPMEEKWRTPDSIRYSWKWDMLHVPCGLYVGVVNFTMGGSVKIQETAYRLDRRVRIFLELDNTHLVKSHESVPW